MKISVIIPAYKEYGTINETVAMLDGTEVIVSCADDDTYNSITYEKVIKIISSKGRGIQMNAGAEKATGDVLLFLHADTKLPSGWPAEVEKGLKNCSYGAFSLGIDSQKSAFRVIEAAVKLRNKLTKIPYGDQAIFCTRAAFEAVGGYSRMPLMEDVDLMRKMKKQKFKLYLSDMQVKTSPRRWEREGLLYTTLRNWIIISLYLLGVSPDYLKKLYK